MQYESTYQSKHQKGKSATSCSVQDNNTIDKQKPTAQDLFLVSVLEKSVIGLVYKTTKYYSCLLYTSFTKTK